MFFGICYVVCLLLSFMIYYFYISYLNRAGITSGTFVKNSYFHSDFRNISVDTLKCEYLQIHQTAIQDVEDFVLFKS